MTDALPWVMAVVNLAQTARSELRPILGEAPVEIEPAGSEELLHQPSHPFDIRNIHPDLPGKVRALFDNGHYDSAVFEAFKFIETEVKRLARMRRGSGFALMMDVFNEANPKLQLNALLTETETDEQKGYKHLFAGSSSGIRNPRGHDVDVVDTPDDALDYLTLASLLLRRLDKAGLRL